MPLMRGGALVEPLPTPDLGGNAQGYGRELFGLFRRNAGRFAGIREKRVS